MYTSTIATAFLTVLAVSASPLAVRQPAVTPAPSCTTTLLYEPTFHLEVMYATTVTATSSVDCGGCALTIVGKEEAPVETATPELSRRQEVENDPFQTRTIWETACAVPTSL
ncbi:Hypothetical protein D9617_1g088020 [Elsinoe fawcettii]|nr:Hypothetical protein D9617_1g088020 [Elsinoe fawcettii]